MRIVQFFIILLLGGLTVYFEYQNIRESDLLLGPDLLKAVPLILLCILTTVYFFKNINRYRFSKHFTVFIPSVTGVLFLVLFFGHRILRSNLDSSPTLFTAINYDLGNDGGFSLDFKRNNHLKGKRIDHFSETAYWGSYTKHGDTLLLDISLDFKMGKQAILQDNTLRFTDDTIHFFVSRQ